MYNSWITSPLVAYMGACGLRATQNNVKADLKTSISLPSTSFVGVAALRSAKTSAAMHQINVNSNIINGIYSAVGVLMFVLFSRLLQLIISCHNLRTLYDVRKPLRLETTRLSLFMDPGLAPRWLSRLFAVLAVLFTALLTAGGFAFVGSTETVYQTVSVRNKVVPATRENYVDFREHISPDGLEFSAAFLLLCGTACTRKELTKFTTYTRTNEVHNLNHFQPPDPAGLRNSTCVYSENGFKDEILDTVQYGLPIYYSEDCQRFILAETVRQQMKHIVAPAHNGSCPYHQLQIRCSNRSSLQCVASARVQDEFGGFVLLQVSKENKENSSFIITYEAERRELKEHPQVLESLAFMLHFVPLSLSSMRTCAASRVQQNASVQKRVPGERNVTEVKIALIMAAFGLATALLVAVGTVALAMWIGVVLLKERRRYNTFSANEDALACAAQALLWRSNDGAERAEKGVVVGGVYGISVTM